MKLKSIVRQTVGLEKPHDNEKFIHKIQRDYKAKDIISTARVRFLL